MKPESREGPNRHLFSVVTGIVAGVLLGGLYPEAGKAAKEIGDLFLRLLMTVVVPLVMTSMIAGVTALGDLRRLKRLSATALAYFVLTMCIAATIGATLAMTIQPGGGGMAGPRTGLEELPEKIRESTAGDVVTGLLGKLVPANFFEAVTEGDFLPIIVGSLIFGAVLTMVGKKARLVIDFFDAVNDAMMLIVKGVMWVAPVGIGALVAGRLGQVGGFSGFGQELSQLALYVATVLTGLAIHGFIVLPLIFKWFRGAADSVLAYARGMTAALATAFSTASSSATLPVTMQCVVGNNGISVKVASFVLPLGTTISMNGTALYEAVAALFIAQQYDIALAPLQVATVVVTAVLAALGAPGIPEAGLVTMVVVLRSAGLPVEGISLLLMVDWFLDRCRTTVNVWDDGVGSAVVESVYERAERPRQTAARPRLEATSRAAGQR